MDANCAKDGLRYYKEQIPSFQPGLPCNEVYPEGYGVKGDIKDRRAYPTGPLYYQSNYKPEVAYRDNKAATQPKSSYVDYGPSSFKDTSYAYPYYDQYKYNVAPMNNVPQLPKAVNYQSYQTNPIMNSSVNSAFYEENNLRGKAPNMNYHQYNYSNFYGYSAPSQPSPNFCGYGYSEESRLLWEDYQNNRTYPSSYVHANSVIKEPMNNFTYPPVLRPREKAVCTGNNPRLHSSSNHCSNGVAWPTHFPYQPVAQNFRTPCSKLYCHEDHQNPNYCVVRHEKPELYQNYKYLQSQHIPPYRTTAPEMCVAPAPIYFDSKVEAPYHGGLAGYQGQNGVVYHKPVTSEPQKRSYNYTQEVGGVAMDANYAQFQVFEEGVGVQANYAQETSAYDTTAQGGVITKRQNLREFLSSWNEDEDDGSEKLGVNLEGCQFLEDTVLEQKTSEEKDLGPVDSTLQFNGQFGKVRPKIHVGITVDSNISNDQYINLPDIIIDIEKSKDSQEPTAAASEETRNVMLFEPIDVPLGEFKEYKDKNIITEDSSISTTLKPERTKDAKMTSSNQSKNCGSFCLKVKRRKFACKVRGIKRSIILKNCCKPMTKRKKLIYSKKNSLKEKSKQSPATLKAICVSSLNSKTFQDYLLAEFESFDLQNNSFDEKGELLQETAKTRCIPKLSALCENALNEYYEKGVLVINIDDDVDSRFYFLECDINENVLESNENEAGPEEYAEESRSTIPMVQSDMGDSQETMKDFNSIHHEEVIPDNFKLFESKKFLQYLQNKYVRNNFFSKGYVTKKILSKYKKRGLRTDRHRTKSPDQRT